MATSCHQSQERRPESGRNKRHYIRVSQSSSLSVITTYDYSCKTRTNFVTTKWSSSEVACRPVHRALALRVVVTLGLLEGIKRGEGWKRSLAD